MDNTQAQSWLDGYVTAWRSNEREQIAALFSDDVVYRYRPYGGDDHTDRGLQALVDSWLGEPDDPGSWEAAYEVYAVDGDRAVATGYSRYLATDDAPERTYHNCFLLRFDDDGRCAEFTEFYMEEQPAAS
jgi:SnoaL-like domain